jgi:hypothetical protein
MAINEKVSGVGANSSRTDNNVSERVAKIQREAKMQNATGGSYGQRAEVTSIAQGAPTNVPTPSMPSMPQGNPLVGTVDAVNAFAPGTQGVPLSEGATYGPGAGQEVLPTPVDAIDQGSVLARAMLMANPNSRQLRLMVEAYNELGI